MLHLQQLSEETLLLLLFCDDQFRDPGPTWLTLCTGWKVSARGAVAVAVLRDNVLVLLLLLSRLSFGDGDNERPTLLEHISISSHALRGNQQWTNVQLGFPLQKSSGGGDEHVAQHLCVVSSIVADEWGVSLNTITTLRFRENCTVQRDAHSPAECFHVASPGVCCFAPPCEYDEHGVPTIVWRLNVKTTVAAKLKCKMNRVRVREK